MNKWWNSLPSHLKAFLSAAGVTLVLGIVIIAGAAFAPNGPSDKELSQQYYEQASDALLSGDTNAAKEYVDKAVESNPDNQVALNLQAEIAKLIADSQSNTGSSSNDKPSGTSGDTDDDTNSGTPGDSASDALTKKYSSKTDVSDAFPTSYSGWRVATVVSDGGASTLSATPLETSKINTLQWAIVDQGSTSKAESFVKTTQSELYPENAATITVSGVKAVKGTKTSGQLVWATTTFSIGRYSFQVLATGKPDVDLNELIKAADTAAQAFSLQ